VIRLNRAITIGFRDGYPFGLAELETLETTPSLAG
jgi:predicted RNA polymerase sigma factor